MFCKKCGNNLPDGAMFCKKCGNKVERKSPVMEESKPAAAAKQYNDAALVCKKCGNSLPEGAMFCKKCGNKVDIKFPVTEESDPVATHEPQLLEPRNTQQPQYSAPQQTAPQQTAPQQTAPQQTAPQQTAPQQTAPQQTAPQQTAPMYGTPVPAAPQKAFPLKYILIPTGILAAAAVLIAVLVTTLKPRQSVPVSNSGYEQQTPGGIIGNNNGGNNGDNNGVNTGNNNGGNNGGNNGVNTGNNGGNNGVNTGKPFVAGGKEYNLVNAVNSSANGATVFLFEGTLNNTAIMIVATAIGGFDYPATYNQSSFGGNMEVGVYMVDTNTGVCSVGSSSTQGLSGAQITTDANKTISVSGTLNSDTYGNVSFSVNSKTTSTDMTNITNKILTYASIADGGSGGGGGGNGGGLQPTPCQACNTIGDGKCRICHGDGKCHSCVAGMDHCLNCNGTRRCKACGGSTLCPYCGGDGMLYN